MGGRSMGFVNGEHLKNIRTSVASNVSCCVFARDENKRVGILARGEYNTGIISKVMWDDMEDIITLKTDTGKSIMLSGSQITMVRIVE